MSLPILSGSMMPHLPPGGRIRVACAPGLRPHLGDIIVFRDRGRLIAHRLLLRLRLGRRCWLYQKGDAARAGAWVREERVIGVVTGASGPDGSPAYARTAGGRAGGAGIYRHLLRDLRARARSAFAALRHRCARGGNRA